MAREREHARQARLKAARSAVQAAKLDAHAATAPESVRALFTQLAGLHRKVEARHLVSAEIHKLLATRTDNRLERASGSIRPVFMAAVASMLGAQGALAVLGGRPRARAMAGASDSIAQAAYDLEMVLAEGPAIEAAVKGIPICASGDALNDRWSRYGPAVARLGIQAVCAAPLGLPGARFGALCAFDRAKAMCGKLATPTKVMADALSLVLLGITDIFVLEAEGRVQPFSDWTEQQATIHQAAGMLSVQCQCGIDDAADLLAARAFADDKPVREIAQQVVRGETHLG